MSDVQSHRLAVKLLRGTATLALCLGNLPVLAQGFPESTVKLVVPLTAGSGADTAARNVAQALARQWKQTVLVDNKPGAGGLIGTSAVVNAEPNGYTLLVQSAGYASNAAIYKKLPYDPLTSLLGVGLIGATPFVMVTAAEGPYKSLKELVAAAKAKPGDVSFSSVGVGSSTHFAAEYLALGAGIQLLHVPFKGGPEAIQDVMAGRVGFTMASLSTALPHIRAGKLRALGVSTKTRASGASDIPTIAEQGFADFDISLWFGVWAPAGTPAATIQKINAGLQQATQDPEVVAAFAKLAIEPRSTGPADFTAFVRSEMAKYQSISKAAGIEPQ
jgi:tripartite-type tricarboxylate transporter receptor subunit TctC